MMNALNNVDGRNSDSSGSRMTSSSGSMNRYVTIKKLGDGSYGEVVLGQRIDTGERVAIKKYAR
jgi:serine/threonine protein kinase